MQRLGHNIKFTEPDTIMYNNFWMKMGKALTLFLIALFAYIVFSCLFVQAVGAVSIQEIKDSQNIIQEGKNGGQNITGGQNSGNLILNGSNNNGVIILQPNNGFVGIGGSPQAAFHIIGKSNLDSRILMQSSISDHVTKAGRLSIVNYHNEEEPFTVFLSQSHAIGKNFIEFGGGSSSENSATEIQFLTGETQTTLSGSLRAVINNIGNFGLGISP